jgi:hypothetical protein
VSKAVYRWRDPEPLDECRDELAPPDGRLLLAAPRELPPDDDRVLPTEEERGDEELPGLVRPELGEPMLDPRGCAPVVGLRLVDEPVGGTMTGREDPDERPLLVFGATYDGREVVPRPVPVRGTTTCRPPIDRLPRSDPEIEPLPVERFGR